MDSRFETAKHIFIVQKYLIRIIAALQRRLLNHDKTKLEAPEVELFDEVTERLRSLTYGSPEYNAMLTKLEPALQHHYQNNRHHPEHYKDGIKDMTLVDLIEMICDWKAASLRHANGNIRKSIEVNQQRFGYSDELKQILFNTVEMLEIE
jgi:hypothetical protein